MDTSKAIGSKASTSAEETTGNFVNWKLAFQLTAETVAGNVAVGIYRQGKAKIFDLLESQIEFGDKLHACKRIAEGMITEIASNAKRTIMDMIPEDWGQEAETGGELATEEEAAEMNKMINEALEDLGKNITRL